MATRHPPSRRGTSSARKRPPGACATMEPLEPRLLLDATPTQIWQALDLPDGVAVGYSGDTQATQCRVLLTAAGLLGFPSGRDGDFAMFSSGVASWVDTVGNTSGSQGTDLGDAGAAGDTAQITFTVTVPESTRQQKFKFDFMFLSEEYPEYVGSQYNDFFTATVNGVNIALDQFDNAVNINNVFFDGGLATTGTFFDGRTALVTATYTIPDGTNTLNIVLSVGDVGDGIYDSAVLLDNFRIETSQLVYLDFDGETLDFSGSHFDMPAFLATDVGYGAGTSTDDVIATLVAEIEADYTGLDIEFTTDEPDSGDYSTVVIGGNDDVIYAGGGILFGRAQSVDIGNRTYDDTAVVFSREFGNYYMNLAPDPYKTADPDEVAKYLATTITHELAHNLGLRHVDNAYADDIMKKNSPRENDSTFKDELMDLPAVEQPHWPDDAKTQNDRQYLESTLGVPGVASVLAQSWNWLFNIINKWFTFDLGSKTVYDVQLGTYADPEEDIAPQIFTFDALSGGQQALLPNFTGTDKLFVIGSSKPGAPADITSGALDAGGNVSIEAAMTDLVDAETGEHVSGFTLYKAKGGTLKEFVDVSLEASEYADIDWLAGNKGTFADADDDAYTIKLSGPGSLAIIQDDPDGDGKGPIERIILQNTDPNKSKLKISVKQAKDTGDGIVDIGEIQGPGLKAFQAKGCDLVGAGITLEGYLGAVTVHDILDGAQVIAGGTADQKTKISVHVMEDNTVIQLGSHIAALKAAKVGDGAIEVPGIKSLKTKGDKKAGILGDFEADLTLSGDAALKAALSKATVVGSLTGATWRIGGDVGKITVGGMYNANIYAGITEGFEGLPDSADDFAAELTIKSLTIKGIKEDKEYVDSFVASNIAANSIGSVKLCYAQLDNGGTPFGVAARSYKKASYRDADIKESGKQEDLPLVWEDAEIRLI